MRDHDELQQRLTGDDRLAAFLRATRGSLVVPPPDEVAARHRYALAEAAREAAHTVPDAHQRAASAPEPGWQWGRRVRRVLGLTSVKLAISGAAALAATGGLAATESLPAPAQRVVSEVGDRIGLDLPSPDDPAPADTPGNGGEGTGVTDAPPVEPGTPPTEGRPGTTPPVEAPSVHPTAPPASPGTDPGPPDGVPADPPADPPARPDGDRADATAEEHRSPAAEEAHADETPVERPEDDR